MKYRKLRIAWSVAWGVVAVLLIGLWVRSYWRWQTVEGRIAPAKFFSVASMQGRLILGAYDAGRYSYRGNWRFVNQHVPGPGNVREVALKMLRPHFRYKQANTSFQIGGPHWFAVTTCATFAALPWIRRLRYRFSLRTLLIATTLVAVGLGLIVWATR